MVVDELKLSPEHLSPSEPVEKNVNAFLCILTILLIIVGGLVFIAGFSDIKRDLSHVIIGLALALSGVILFFVLKAQGERIHKEYEMNYRVYLSQQEKLSEEIKATE